MHNWQKLPGTSKLVTLKQERGSTEAGKRTPAFRCGRTRLSDLHNSFTATCPLLPPFVGNTFTLPWLQSSSRQANVTLCCIATMLQPRASHPQPQSKQHPQLPSQLGPGSTREARVIPSHPTRGQSFSTTGTSGLRPLREVRGNISPLTLWNKPEKAQPLCLQGEASRLRQQICKTLANVTNVIFKLEIFILMKTLLVYYIINYSVICQF